MNMAIVIPVLLFIFLLWLGHRFNGADWGNPVVNIIDGWLRFLCRYYHRFQYQAIPLPEQGAALIAGNHISGLDPLLIIAACQRPVRFMIAREQYELFGLQWLFRAVKCIPVERTGRPERAFRAALTALQEGDVVGVFPEGGIHSSDKPPKHLKTGVARLARLANTPVYPVRVSGISGEGHVILAVIIPSRARLQSFTPLDCVELEQQQCLHDLQTCFRPSAQAGQN